MLINFADFCVFSEDVPFADWNPSGIDAEDSLIIAACSGMIRHLAWIDDVADQRLFWEKIGMGRAKSSSRPSDFNEETIESLRSWSENQLGFISAITLARKDMPWIHSKIQGLTIDGSLVRFHNGIMTDAVAVEICHDLITLHGNPHDWTGEEMVHCVFHDESSKQTSIKSLFSKEFIESAIRLHDLQFDFWGKVQARSPIKGGAAWYKIATQISSHRTENEICEAYKSIVKEGVLNKGYIPENFTVKTVAQRISRTVKWAELFESFNIDEEILEGFRGPDEWVISGGAAQVSVFPVDYREAEHLMLCHKKRSDDIDPSTTEALAMAQKLGVLVGPYGMMVYKRLGRVDQASAAVAAGVSPEIIESFSEEKIGKSYIMLYANKAKKGVSPFSSKVRAGVAA